MAFTARNSFTVTVETAPPLNQTESTTKTGRELLIKVINHLNAALLGTKRVGRVLTQPSTSQPVAASGTVICASVSNADTVTINGAAMTAVVGAPAADQFDQSGTDTATATSLALAINSSVTALVSTYVEASNFAATITLATCLAGSRIFIGGYEFTAVTGTAFADTNVGRFDISGSDTADATALKNAINAHPRLQGVVVASSTAGVVTIRQRRGTASTIKLQKLDASGVTLSAAATAATATVLVSARLDSQAGNCMTWVSSNGTRLAVSGSGRLTGGLGGDGTKYLFAPGEVQ